MCLLKRQCAEMLCQEKASRSVPCGPHSDTGQAMGQTPDWRYTVTGQMGDNWVMCTFFLSEKIEAGLSPGATGWFPSTLENSREFIAWVASEYPPTGKSQSSSWRIEMQNLRTARSFEKTCREKGQNWKGPLNPSRALSRLFSPKYPGAMVFALPAH